MPALPVWLPLLAAVPLASQAAADADWMLLARHGECHPPEAVLQRRFAELPPFSGPAALAAELRRRGHAVRVDNVAEAVSVEVAALEISLLFVRRERCREFASGPR